MALDKKTLQNILSLREKTGAKILHCREAVAACDGDLTKAMEWLNKHYPLSSKENRTTKEEGIVAFKTNLARNHAAGVHLKCETDFVSSSENFVAFAKKTLSSAVVYLEKKPQGTFDDFKTNILVYEKTLDENIKLLANQFGEKIEIDMIFINAEKELLMPYNHFNLRRASLVKYSYVATPLNNNVAINMNLTKDTLFSNNLDNIARDVAIHSCSVSAEKSFQEVLENESMLENVSSVTEYIRGNIHVHDIVRLFI